MTNDEHMSIYDAIGQDVQSLGGFLQCLTCHRRQPLGFVGGHLRDGWPRCCNHTMHWWTQRQIDAGEVE